MNSMNTTQQTGILCLMVYLIAGFQLVMFPVAIRNQNAKFLV